jgi:hypothetical protein
LEGEFAFSHRSLIAAHVYVIQEAEMVTHVRQAMVYVLIVATTFVGSWLLFGREMEAGAVSAPIEEATEPAPLIFEASDRTCVYLAGQLECFCTCADARASAAPSAIRAEHLIITAPPESSGTGDGSAGITRSVELTGTESTSTISRTMSVVFPGPGADPSDDPDEKPKCNQGVGNGPEGCDPGNSNHNQPSNDEDGGIPGAPGRQGSSKPDKDK